MSEDGFESFMESRGKYMDAIYDLVLACRAIDDPRLDREVSKVEQAAEEFYILGGAYVAGLFREVSSEMATVEEKRFISSFSGLDYVRPLVEPDIEMEEQDVQKALQLLDLAHKWKRGELN